MKKKPRQAKDSMSITRTLPFAARVVASKVNGVKSLVVESKPWFQHNLNKFKDGEKVTLEVHNRKAKRTEAQNNYYWGIYLPLVSRETGERNIERLHELFKGEFLTEGVVEVLGKKVRMKKSTTELGVGEFCEYIMSIENETGVAAPPTENYEMLSLTEMRHYPQRPAATGRRSGKIDI